MVKSKVLDKKQQEARLHTAQKAVKGEMKVNKNGHPETYPAFRVSREGLFITAFFGSGNGDHFTDGVSFNILHESLGKTLGPLDAYVAFHKKGELFSWGEGQLLVNEDSTGKLYFGTFEAIIENDLVEFNNGIFSITYL
ncbi:hypothetical protein [Pseudomonas sp. RA_35y_Pfl2_P32]|uniref:hypothetical protein n=1 Tax=Pseudomonas sp. RA_35y_Pfl2_P32 TaxID=3088705 RepID=UPI0030D8A8A5